MLKIGMEVAKDYTILNHRPPIPQEDIKSQYIKIVEVPGVNLGPNFFYLGKARRKLGRKYPRMS